MIMKNIEYIIKGLPEIHKDIKFSDNEYVDITIKNISDYPHLFIMGCLLHSIFPNKEAWTILYKICKDHVKSFNIEDMQKIDYANYNDLFIIYKKQNYLISEILHDSINKIYYYYDGDASLIWKDNPSSAEIIYRILSFKGSNIQIAIMTANLLHKVFQVEFKDYISLDIIPNNNIKRIYYRTGLINNIDSIEQIIYKARSINYDYPSKFDYYLEQLGESVCTTDTPNCNKCIFNQYCEFNKKLSLIIKHSNFNTLPISIICKNTSTLSILSILKNIENHITLIDFEKISCYTDLINILTNTHSLNLTIFYNIEYIYRMKNSNKIEQVFYKMLDNEIHIDGNIKIAFNEIKKICIYKYEKNNTIEKNLNFNYISRHSYIIEL